MFKKLILASLLLANAALAWGPTVECRFAGRLEDGDIAFDEVVPVPLIPDSGLVGDFEPYEFEIEVTFDSLIVSIYLDGEFLDEQEIPAGYILSLPIGASLFGTETIHHDSVDDFVAVRYECFRSF